MYIVGIPVIFTGDHWIGGMNYYLSLISALSLASQADIKFIIITNKAGVLENYASEKISIHINEALGNNSFFQKILNKIYGCDLKLVKVVNSLGIDLLTHAEYSKKYKCKTIWWKPDFQEHYYPEYFSKRELWERKRLVERNAKHASIIFSSQSACDDYYRFYKQPCKSHVLRFIPLLDFNAIDEAKIQATLEKYKITRPFFYLPNQYWAHKNHELVLNSLIKDDHELDFEVISTGAMKDYRGNAHMDKINGLIERVPDNKYKVLGLVPREDMLTLMSACVAVINPSKFEGWSTTVEEAKYMGKRLILSNLPVHIEQEPADSIFLDVSDVESLSAALNKILVEYDLQIEKNRRVAAVYAYKKAREKYASDYIYAILESKGIL
ncbi:Glycosyl transferases group 1 [compost metagenome]